MSEGVPELSFNAALVRRPIHAMRPKTRRALPLSNSYRTVAARLDGRI